MRGHQSGTKNKYKGRLRETENLANEFCKEDNWFGLFHYLEELEQSKLQKNEKDSAEWGRLIAFIFDKIPKDYEENLWECLNVIITNNKILLDHPNINNTIRNVINHHNYEIAEGLIDSSKTVQLTRGKDNNLVGTDHLLAFDGAWKLLKKLIDKVSLIDLDRIDEQEEDEENEAIPAASLAVRLLEGKRYKLLSYILAKNGYQLNLNAKYSDELSVYDKLIQDQQHSIILNILLKSNTSIQISNAQIMHIYEYCIQNNHIKEVNELSNRYLKVNNDLKNDNDHKNIRPDFLKVINFLNERWLEALADPQAIILDLDDENPETCQEPLKALTLDGSNSAFLNKLANAVLLFKKHNEHPEAESFVTKCTLPELEL